MYYGFPPENGVILRNGNYYRPNNGRCVCRNNGRPIFLDDQRHRHDEVYHHHDHHKNYVRVYEYEQYSDDDDFDDFRERDYDYYGY